MFLRRIGQDPQTNQVQCSGSSGCPDIWELANGDFAVIGVDITLTAQPLLPSSAGCAPHERIIQLPRRVLVNAKRDIPDCLVA